MKEITEELREWGEQLQHFEDQLQEALIPKNLKARINGLNKQYKQMLSGIIIKSYEDGTYTPYWLALKAAERGEEENGPFHDMEMCDSAWFAYYYDYGMKPSLYCLRCMKFDEP